MDGWPTPTSDHHLFKLSSLKGRHHTALVQLRNAKTQEEMEPIRRRLAKLASEILEVSKL